MNINWRGLTDYSQPLVAAATVVGAGFVLAVFIGALAAYKIKVADNTIEVTGSAKEAVVADFARLTVNLDAKTGVGDQQRGFNTLESATTRIVAYLNKQ